VRFRPDTVAIWTGWEADFIYDDINNEKKQFHEVRNMLMVSE
jgi:hypothetical protein